MAIKKSKCGIFFIPETWMQSYKTEKLLLLETLWKIKISKCVSEGSFSVEVMINLRIRCKKSYMEKIVQATIRFKGLNSSFLHQ